VGSALSMTFGKLRMDIYGCKQRHIFRFDGIRFQSVEAVTHGAVGNNIVDAVLPAASGGIWFTTRSSGLLFWKDDHMTTFPDTRCTGRLREAPDGSLSIGGSGGLFHLVGSVCKRIGTAVTHQVFRQHYWWIAKGRYGSRHGIAILCFSASDDQTSKSALMEEVRQVRSHFA
jgi:hypothetical protein